MNLSDKTASLIDQLISLCMHKRRHEKKRQSMRNFENKWFLTRGNARAYNELLQGQRYANESLSHSYWTDFVINRVRTRECEDLSLPKKHALSEVRWDQILRWERASFGVRCSDSEFSLWQIFYSTVRGLTKFKTRRSLSNEYDG